jgi:hypothetical protein
MERVRWDHQAAEVKLSFGFMDFEVRGLGLWLSGLVVWVCVSGSGVEGFGGLEFGVWGLGVSGVGFGFLILGFGN